MAKKTYSLDMNGATSGEGVLPGPNPPAGFTFDADASTIESKLNANSAGGATGWIVSGPGPFTIQQPEECGNYELSVLTGTLDVSPSLSVTQQWTPTVNVSVDDNTISEPSGVAVVSFGIAATHSTAITVAFSLSGTATNDSDYTCSTTSPVQIVSGESTAGLTITALDDATFEPTETIIVSLGAITGGEAGTASSVSIALSSDDAQADSGTLSLLGVG